MVIFSWAFCQCKNAHPSILKIWVVSLWGLLSDENISISTHCCWNKKIKCPDYLVLSIDVVRQRRGRKLHPAAWKNLYPLIDNLFVFLNPLVLGPQKIPFLLPSIQPSPQQIIQKLRHLNILCHMLWLVTCFLQLPCTQGQVRTLAYGYNCLGT